ncbi:MAG: CHASE2 domain-containing protein [Candidatus Latescibacteria bacterium]|nr:CHASE2 domain-containing protein [Candidatus Latescibacterota bacterium]
MARLVARSKLTALAIALVIAYAAALMAFLLNLLGPMNNAEQGTLDWRFLYRGPVGKPPPSIALVTVDKEAKLPYWAPMPRDYLARLVRTVAGGGARLIGVDFFLAKRQFQGDTALELAIDQADMQLREAIEAAGNVILVSYLENRAEVLPDSSFLNAALDYGFASFNISTGSEAVRQGRVARGIDGFHALSLAGALYAYNQQITAGAIGPPFVNREALHDLVTGPIRRLPWSQRTDALPGGQRDYVRIIDYNGPPVQYYRHRSEEGLSRPPGGIDAYPSHLFTNLPPAVARKYFQDRIVLIGSALPDAPDFFRTSFFAQQFDYRKTFGVEIHAQFLRSLLDEDPLEKAGFFAQALLILLTAFAAALISVRLRPYWAFPLVLLVLALVWGLAFQLFAGSGLVVPLVMPTVAGGVACLLGLIYVGSTDGRRKNEVRERFGPMMGEQQLQQLLMHPEFWSTDGEERIASVLWVRLQPLSPQARQRPARETTFFFQEYWKQMSSLIFKRGGAIFLYEEDSLGAVFGAPMGGRDHAGDLAMAAVDIAESWVNTATDEGRQQWRLGLGGDTGAVILGELGGASRYAYRVLGGPVDRARSLAQTGEGEASILVTQALHSQARALVAAEDLGQRAGNQVFRLLGRAQAPAIGAANKPPNPFWKYLRLDRPDDDLITERLLGQIELFADFSRQELRRVRPLIGHRSYQSGERVFSQGEVGSAMFIIKRGHVDILQEREDGGPPQLLQRLGESEFLGELALLNDLPRSASAVAYGRTELLVLLQADLYDLLEQQPELGGRLIRSLSRILSERLIHTNRSLAELEKRLP